MNSFHVPNIIDELAIMLVSIILEQNENESLVLGVGLLGKLAGIRFEVS